MNNSEHDNPYKTPKSSLLDDIQLRLNKEQFELFKAITQAKPSSDFMRVLQNNYRDLLRDGNTVYVYVDAALDKVDVPEKYVEGGKIVLDISPRAIDGFVWREEGMEFLAKFNGREIRIELPFESLLCLYSNESKRSYNYQEAK